MAAWLVMGSGGQISTIPDMIKWKTDLATGKLLSEQSQKNFRVGFDMLAADGDMFGFEFMHSRTPECMFLMISNSIGSREKRQKFASLGRRLFSFVIQNQATTKYSLGVLLAIGVDTGVLIDTVVAGGAAEAAGLKKGDVLVSVNGKPIVDNPKEILGQYLKNGQQINIVAKRDRKELKFAVQPKDK